MYRRVSRELHRPDTGIQITILCLQLLMLLLSPGVAYRSRPNPSTPSSYSMLYLHQRRQSLPTYRLIACSRDNTENLGLNHSSVCLIDSNADSLLRDLELRSLKKFVSHPRTSIEVRKFYTVTFNHYSYYHRGIDR